MSLLVHCNIRLHLSFVHGRLALSSPWTGKVAIAHAIAHSIAHAIAHAIVHAILHSFSTELVEQRT
jgi:hypothetical protein